MDAATLIRHIPARPELFIKIAGINIDSPNTGSREFLTAIEYDKGICSRLLQIANSSYYSKGQIEDLPSAVTTLGLNTAKSLALLLATEGFRVADDPLSEIYLDRLPLLTALSAADMAKRTGCDPDFILAASLFSRIGMFLFTVNFPLDYKEVLKDLTQSGQNLCEFEQNAFGLNHRKLGLEAVVQWGFPERFLSIYEYLAGMDSMKSAMPKEIQCIVLADYLSQRFLDLAICSAGKKKAETLFKALGLAPDDYESSFFIKLEGHPLCCKG